MKSQRSPWLREPLVHSSAQMRLFCLPHAGGGSLAYKGWGQRMAPDIEVLSAQLPGREFRFSEAPAPSIAAVVGELMPAIAPLLDLPFAFFGHSMGGLLAYELAHSLQGMGLPRPALVIISAAPAPHLRPFDEDQELDDMALINMLEGLGGLPDEALAQPELMEMLLPIFRADLLMLREYGAPRVRKLDCPLAVYGGETDSLQPETLTAWTEHTMAAFRVRMFPGGHFYHHEHPQAFFEALRFDVLAAVKGPPATG